MAFNFASLVYRAEALQCKEALTDDYADGFPQEEELSLTAESNVSCLSEQSFTSSSSVAPHYKAESKSAAADHSETDQLLAELEDAHATPSGYMGTTQAATGLSPVHRATVVDNMLSAAARLNLTNDSLFTAVACLDRYLATKPTPLPLLQPTAIACLWVAAKYEQLVVPSVGQFAVLVQSSGGGGGGSSDGSDFSLASAKLAFAKQLLLELEGEVLATLDYRLASIVTVKAFKARLVQRLQAAGGTAKLSRRQLDQLYCLMSYLTEVSLLEYRLLPAPPSQVAAAAFVYAFMLLGLPYGGALAVCGYSQLQLQALLEMFCALHTTLSAALQLRRPYNVTVKYCNAAVQGVAYIPPELRLGAGCAVGAASGHAPAAW